MKIIVQRELGTPVETDVTEAVQIVYDTLLQSMDFTSGFLGVEELTALADLAKAAGFDCVEEVYRRIKVEEAEQERIQQLAMLRKKEAQLPAREAMAYRAMIEQHSAEVRAATERMFDQTTFYTGVEIVPGAKLSRGDTP